MLVVEAGKIGWTSIEFKEIRASGIEFLGEERIHKHVVDNSKPYLPQVKRLLQAEPVTHYFYDPRIGDQSMMGGFVETVRLSLLLARYQIVPIAYLTDLSYRQWRCKAAGVTATNGTVVTFMMPKRVQGIFPHRRLAGPSLMPFSRKSLNDLTNSRKRLVKAKKIQNLVRFTGSLYEPRTSFLGELKEQLEQEGKILEVMGRELGSKRVSDEEYWTRIMSADMVVTTAVQASQPGIDWDWIPHLVYRYLEVLAAGSTLLAPNVPGVEKYFRPGEHFVSFETVENACEQAVYFLNNPDELEKIRKAGNLRAIELINSHSFWVQIDTALGFEALVRS